MTYRKSSISCFILTATLSSAYINPSSFIRNPKLSPTQVWLQPQSQPKKKFSQRNALKICHDADKIVYDDVCDILILGSGPAARAIATLLSSTKSGADLDVLMADANLDRKWPPNYGVWTDEWECIRDAYQSKFGRTIPSSCIDRSWDVTDCYFGGSYDIPTDSRLRLDRPYLRIEKDNLRETLTPIKEDKNGSYRTVRANHISNAASTNIYDPSGSLMHDSTGSTIALRSNTDDALLSVRAQLIVDCTGHETKLIIKEGRVNAQSLPPGFQIAYGALVTVDESKSQDSSLIGPYDKEAMTLFDYRTDHFNPDSENLSKATTAPTFMYAMPLKDNQVFFEETSLVARPAVSFQECKDRCFTRLEHLGIRVLDVEEEEFCYIPMGGSLPAKNQRIVAFGGAAAMVHPSTGYNLARNMMGAIAVAEIIQNQLTGEDVNLDRVAASAYHAIWTPDNIRQRNFAVFGGEFLMKQDSEGLRGFFDGFFRLSPEMWGGFLAGWPGLPNNNKHETWIARIAFGLSFITKLPPKVGLDMLLSIITYSISEGGALINSVTPLFGEPDSYEFVEQSKNKGDISAKNEARKMIQDSKLNVDVPIAFDIAKKSISVPVIAKTEEK